MHDGLMLNPDQVHFRQEGGEFFTVDPETGERLKRVFKAGQKTGETALKEFVIWCYDRRITPVRASGPQTNTVTCNPGSTPPPPSLRNHDGHGAGSHPTALRGDGPALPVSAANAATSWV